jgi:hypothetical protein
MARDKADSASERRGFAAFPAGYNTIKLVFTEGLDQRSAERREAYATESGLRVEAARLHRADGASQDKGRPTIVTLTTEPMNGDAVIVDRIRVDGVRSERGSALTEAESRPFLQGIASLPGIQWPAEETAPFPSRFLGLLACGSCQKDGGVNSNHLIDQLGFSFIHVEKGGPFNSLKVVGKKHVPGIEEEVHRLSPKGLSPHVLWSGGEIQTVDGETRLVDTGFMEGSILPATPKMFPPPFRIRASDITGESAKNLRAKALQGVIVRFENVTIERVSEPNKHDDWMSAPHLRSFVFHDDTGAQVRGILLNSVTAPVKAGQQLQTLRALLHQPRFARYEAIVELNEHLNYQAGFGNHIYQTGEGGKGYKLD